MSEKVKKFALLLFVMIIVPVLAVNAQEKFRIQSMFVYNFARMAAWPQAYQSGEFVIGVYGNTPMLAELQEMASMRSIGSQKITVVNYANASEIEKCHILYVAPNQSRQIVEITNVLRTKKIPAMVITESRNSLDDGAMVNFVMNNNKPTYEISTNNAKAVGLNLGSEITRLASSVK